MCLNILPYVRELEFRNPGNFLLVESEILGFGIRNTAQGIRNPTNDWNPESKFHWQKLESSTWNPESWIIFGRIGRNVTVIISVGNDGRFRVTGDFCHLLLNRFQKIRLESKLNTTFRIVPVENSREERSVWKGSPVFPVGMFRTEICVPFLQSHFWYQFQAFVAIFR